jgi:dipeptidyl aminopeptidase/acylaminoacyl peptidase
MHWSPDGKRAAYVTGEQTYLIDEQGNVLRKLGGGLGGAAWSADSQTLYYAARAEDNAPTTHPEHRWLPEDVVEWRLPVIPDRYTINALHGDAVTPLFTVPANLAYHLALSPDQRWLAVLAQVRRPTKDDDYRIQLYAYLIPQKRLYFLSKSCGAGACFTEANRLAYVEPSHANAAAEGSLGHVVEATLNEDDQDLFRAEQFEVVVGDVGWMEAAASTLYLTAVHRTLPAAESATGHQLYRYDRDKNRLNVVVDDAFTYFSFSPDRKRMLAARSGASSRQLLLIDAATGRKRVLREFEEQIVFYPTWRDNEHITFQNEVDVKAIDDPKRERPLYVDVVLYRITGQGLEPVRKLSEKWGDEVKPRYEAPAVVARPLNEER